MRVLAIIGALGLILAAVAGVFFFGGFYNVAGTAEEPAIVKWALETVRAASIDRHAKDTPPGNLGEASTVEAGARIFTEQGCVNCHGAPGVNWAKFSEGLRPYPPDLKDLVDARTPPKLFWVVKNGINMTGMPSFSEVKDEDLWKVVAFLKKLPTVSEADYKAWTAPPPSATAPQAPPAAVTPPPPPPAADAPPSAATPQAPPAAVTPPPPPPAADAPPSAATPQGPPAAVTPPPPAEPAPPPPPAAPAPSNQ